MLVEDTHGRRSSLCYGHYPVSLTFTFALVAASAVSLSVLFLIVYALFVSHSSGGLTIISAPDKRPHSYIRDFAMHSGYYKSLITRQTSGSPQPEVFNCQKSPDCSHNRQLHESFLMQFHRISGQLHIDSRKSSTVLSIRSVGNIRSGTDLQGDRS